MHQQYDKILSVCGYVVIVFCIVKLDRVRTLFKYIVKSCT